MKDQLVQHLAGLVNDGLVRVWHDRDIQAGDYWVARIDNALEISSIVLLLISPSFLASNYCYGSELRRALHRASLGEAKVIPIILRPSDWQTQDLRGLQALPRDGKAITSWPNRDEAFRDVAENLRALLTSLEPMPDAMPEADRREAVRYYLYISDAKVNMLLPQLGSESTVTSDEARLRSEGERIRRLSAVLGHIERSGRIGSVDEPEDYIFAVQDLYWGNTHSSRPTDTAASTLVAFCGRTEKTALLLCGTTRHLVGTGRLEKPGFSSSHVPYLLNSLLTAVELHGAPAESVTRRPSWIPEEEALPRGGSELACWLIDNARLHVSGVEQRLEFLAKTLWVGPGRRDRARCLLASPLYVALVF